MKKEDLFKLLNQGKRDVYEVKKPKNYTLKTILYKYTGRKVLKAIESVVDGLKNDLTIVFKPVKQFTKKQMQGYDRFRLAELYAERDNDKVTSNDHTKSKVTKGNFAKEDGFVNWFELGNKEVPSKKNKMITLLKADGTVTTLDEDLDKLLF